MTTYSLGPASRILLRIVVVLLAACTLVCVTACAYGFGAATTPPGPYDIVISATAIDDAGGVSSSEIVLTVSPRVNASTLSNAKSLPDGESVNVPGLVATTSSSDFAGLFYAEQFDRAGGIGVLWDGGVNRGDVVSVVGTLITLHGERFIQAQLVDQVPAFP